MRRPFFLLFAIWSVCSWAQLTSDHTCTDPGDLNTAAISSAKQEFRVWYGHTSHGSQITSGMSVLASDNPDLYNYNSDGSNEALSYQETGGDLGHLGDLAWEAATRAQLDRADNDRNLVVWSWCGGVSDNTVEGINIYLNAMNQLELDYPDVTFVYMTGHLDGTGEAGNLNLRNNQIRQYCQANQKILFDFADIESFDPDGAYFLDLNADDGCNYWIGGTQHNWADEWCTAHPGSCSSVSCAHSRSLNCDRKGVAFWWLLTHIASSPTCVNPPYDASGELLAGTSTIRLTWNCDQSADGFRVQRKVGPDSWVESYASLPGTQFSFDDSDLADGTYSYRIVAHLLDNGNGEPCQSLPSNTVTQVVSTQPPLAPSDLVVSLDEGSVLVSWHDQSDNEQGFTIEKNTNEEGFIELIQVGSNSTQFSDSAIEPLSDLDYRVFAFNQHGNSLSSNVASIHIPFESLTLHLESSEEVDDAFLDSTNPDTSYGSTPYVSVMERFILKFNLPPTLLQKTILNAQLAFYGWAQSNWQPDQHLDLYRVTQYWEESTVTWNRACDCAPWTIPGGEYDSHLVIAEVPITEGCDHCFYPEVDITGLVQNWVNGCLDNDGILVLNNSVTHTSLKASEYSPGQRTYLDITYTNEPQFGPLFMSQVISSWCFTDYYEQGLDLDGNGIINLIDILRADSQCAP